MLAFFDCYKISSACKLCQVMFALCFAVGKAPAPVLLPPPSGSKEIDATIATLLTPVTLNKCGKCYIPIGQGGCNCNENCDCLRKSGPGV